MTEFGSTQVVAEVMTEERGGVAYLTLNRPQALNALSLEMIRAITDALKRWGGRSGGTRWWWRARAARRSVPAATSAGSSQGMARRGPAARPVLRRGIRA